MMGADQGVEEHVGPERQDPEGVGIDRLVQELGEKIVGQAEDNGGRSLGRTAKIFALTQVFNPNPNQNRLSQRSKVQKPKTFQYVSLSLRLCVKKRFCPVYFMDRWVFLLCQSYLT